MRTLVILLTVTVSAGCGTRLASTGQTAVAPTVTTETVKRQSLTGYTFFEGKLILPPSAQAVATSPYDTAVEQVMTSVGKRVGRGEPIVKLQIPGADEAKAAAKANVSSAVAQHQANKAEVSAPLQDARKRLAAARAAEKQARDTIAGGGQADLDAAVQERVDAESAVKQAEAEVKSSLAPSRQMVGEAQAQLEQAREVAQKGIVRSPIRGTVVSLSAKAGDTARANQALATIVNFEIARVQGIVPPELRDQVSKGTQVIVAVEGHAKPLDGHVVDVSVIPPTEGQKSPGYMAIIALDDAAAVVEPGMVRRIGLKTGHVEDALVVPTSALTVQDGKPAVMVKNGDRWVATIVETGITDGALIQIKSGLKEGDVVRVVTQAAAGASG